MEESREHQQLARALYEALHDEYKARATYRQILRVFGPVRPFVNILASEERHIQALSRLCQRYGIAIPDDDWEARVVLPASLQEACEQGVAGEIENAALYEDLLAATAPYPEVQNVFRNLQAASQYRHLPAFQRGVERYQDRGGRRGARPLGRSPGGGRGRRRRGHCLT